MIYNCDDKVEFIFKGNILKGTIMGGNDGYYQIAFDYYNSQDEYGPPEYSIYTIDSHAVLNKYE